MVQMPIIDLLSQARALVQTGRRVSVLWQHADTLVFLARGREYRSEFHINPSDETMQMIKGEMRLHYRTADGKEAVAEIPEASIIYTPAGTPHSPRFSPDAFALISERVALTGQATRLEDEANSLIEDGEMGDVQFDDESGEGDTMVVERERDLALSAHARQTVVALDAALERMANGTYGYSVVSGAPIPRERLEAIPWATLCISCARVRSSG